MDLSFNIYRNLHRCGGFELRLLDKETKSFVVSPTLKKMGQDQYIEPCAIISEHSMQDLFNQLWNEGFRPADGTGNSGHLEAINRHLEDMRSLVFNTQGDRDK